MIQQQGWYVKDSWLFVARIILPQRLLSPRGSFNLEILENESGNSSTIYLKKVHVECKSLMQTKLVIWQTLKQKSKQICKFNK